MNKTIKYLTVVATIAVASAEPDTQKRDLLCTSIGNCDKLSHGIQN
jgi:hypothetical protein